MFFWMFEKLEYLLKNNKNTNNLIESLGFCLNNQLFLFQCRVFGTILVIIMTDSQIKNLSYKIFND